MGKRKAMACAMVFFLSSVCRYTCKLDGNIICRYIIFNCFTIDAVSIGAFHPDIYMNNCSIVVYFFGDWHRTIWDCIIIAIFAGNPVFSTLIYNFPITCSLSICTYWLSSNCNTKRICKCRNSVTIFCSK